MWNIKFGSYFILDFCFSRSYQKCLLDKLEPLEFFFHFIVIGFGLLQSRRNEGLKEIKVYK